MSIESQLRAIQLSTMNKAKEVFIASGIRVGNQIITGTPVDTAVLINSWNTTVGSISYEKRESAQGGSESVEQLTVEFNAADIGSYVTFNNPQPYATEIEYEGHSEKAKDGMVRINTAKWESIVQEEVLKRR